MLAAALIVPARPGLAQNYSLSGPTAFLSGTMVQATALTNLMTNAVGLPIKLGTGASVAARFTCGHDTNTAPYIIGFDVSPDNVSWTADQPLRFTLLARGTTNTYCWTNWGPSVLDNVRYIRPGLLIPSSTNGIYLTNVYLHYRY